MGTNIVKRLIWNLFGWRHVLTWVGDDWEIQETWVRGKERSVVTYNR